MACPTPAPLPISKRTQREPETYDEAMGIVARYSNLPLTENVRLDVAKKLGVSSDDVKFWTDGYRIVVYHPVFGTIGVTGI